MVAPRDFTKKEADLFDARQMQRVNQSKVSIPPAQSEEMSRWLEPVWRNANGEYQRVASFRIVHRSFAKALIHEHCFVYAGQPTLRDCDGRYSEAWGHWRERLREFLCDGWPQPKQGGTVEHVWTYGEERKYSAFIYCDDLFLCPTCGIFHGKVDGRVLDYPWIKDFSRIDHVALNKFLEKNRHRPEFRFKPCRGNNCREYRARIVEELNAEKTAAMNRVVFKSPSIPAEEISTPHPEQKLNDKTVSIYVVGGHEHFKIGIAVNVKKRMSSLQTSCPFRLALVNEWKHDKARIIEALLHDKYHGFHSSGEWFNLPAETVQIIRNARRPEELLTEAETDALAALG